MTNFTIPAELYLRLANVAPQPGETEQRSWLRCVRIEHHNGNAIGIASNGRVLAGELIGALAEGEPNAFVCISIDPALLEIANVERSLGGNLKIAQAPGWTVITTDGGAMYAANGEVAGGELWPNWLELIPADLPTKNNGCFSFSGAQMSRLCASAPSGTIHCARNVDMTVPTIVRDNKDENWFGVFLVSEHEGASRQQSFKPATVPDWLK